MLPPHPDVPELTVYGTGFKEHGCHDGWCNLREDWPATEGILDGSGSAALFMRHVSNASNHDAAEGGPARYSLKAARAASASGVEAAGGGGACRDENEECGFWARDGECERNPNYMLHHCQKSCRVCHRGAGTDEL